MVEKVKKIIRWMRIRRKALGMSQRILAERTGISESTINHILAGRIKNPLCHMIEAMLQELGGKLEIR